MDCSGRRFLRVWGLAALVCIPAFAQKPQLRDTASFAVLGGSVTSSGTTVITGNVAAKPTGSAPVVKLGAVREDLASQAQRDRALLYDDLARRACGDPRVYCLSSPLSGVVTLDAAGDADAFWIFRIAGALTTAPNTSVRMLNGGNDSNVFWQVAGPATLGPGTTFIGNLVAAGSITLNAGANVSGRLLARDAVTLNNNTVSLCCPRIVVPIPEDTHVIAGMTYRQTLTASGGVGDYRFSALTPGSIVNGNILTVRADSPGKLPITVVATDADGCPGVLFFDLTIDPGPTEPCRIVVFPSKDPPTPAIPFSLFATVGDSYTVTFTASCANLGYTCALSGDLPSGFGFDACTLSGIPKAKGIYDFTVTITGAPGLPGSQAYCLIVDCPPIEFTPEILPPATVGIIYCEQIKSNRGTLTVDDRKLPEGLVSNDNLVICGIPSKRGDYSFPVTATLPGCPPVTKQYDIPVGCPEITLQPPTLPPAILDQPYRATITATVMPPTLIPLTFAIDGPLPEGLERCDDVPAGIVICGTPTKLGKFPFTVTATIDETSMCSVSQPYSIEVVCPTITISPTTLPSGVIGIAYDGSLTASGSNRLPYTFVETTTPTALPPGLTLGSGGGVTGVPAAAGDYTFCVRATDSAGCFGEACIMVHIDAVPPPPPGGPIPTLSGWGMGMLCALMVAVASVAIRRTDA